MQQLKLKNIILRIVPLILIGVAVILALGLGVTLGSSRSNRQAFAQAGNSGPGTGSPNAADGGPFACNIANIAVFDSRIHVRCTAKVSGTNIEYFAAPGDSQHALTTNRFLMMLNTAYALGKPVYLYYFDDPAQNPIGCNTGDCRKIDWMFIVP